MSPRIFKVFKSNTASNPVSTSLGTQFEQARSLGGQGRPAEATAICRAILELQPDHVEALMLLAELCVGQEDPGQALQSYSRVIALRPDHAIAYYKLGNLLKDRGQLEEALASYDLAIARDPGYANAFCNRGVVLHSLNRPEEALASYTAAVALDPNDALTYCNRGTVLRNLKQVEEALLDYGRAIAVRPDYAEAYCNRGILLQELGRWDAALASYDRAIVISPGFSRAHFNRGALLGERNHLDAALASYGRAIELDPEYPEAFCNRGVVLMHLGKWEAALTNFDLAVALEPDLTEAHCNRAEALIHLKQFAAAVTSFDRAILLKPDFEFLLGRRRHAKMLVCDWQDLDSDLGRIAAGIEDGASVSPPLQVMALLDSPSLHHQVARIWVRENYPEDRSLTAIPKHPVRDKIRIGYFSADFYDHVVTAVAAELFETHDRSKYEITGFSSGPDTADSMRRRAERAFDRFIDVRGMSDRDVALLARSSGIDIAVDLGGHTRIGGTGVFALRAAPIQVNYLGYPGTMGADYIDYLIGDRTVIPEAHQPHYTEKIVYLPNSYLPHDSSRAISGTPFTRQELGLPDAGFVFCCFNNSYKITPGIFDSWARILSRVEDSVLWLSQSDPTTVSNLRKEALRRGINAERLIFAARMPALPKHLARYRMADLFLDTRPYNAHATALDALWAGLPVVTCMGQGFAGRVAASLLLTIGLSELVTSTSQDYEDLAIRLASTPPLQAEIKQKLGRNLHETPLFDTRTFTKHLEAAYARIHERYQANLPPDHIYVKS